MHGLLKSILEGRCPGKEIPLKSAKPPFKEIN